MMKKSLISLVCILSTLCLNAQKSDSPYEWKWVKDGIWTGVGLGGSAYGLHLIKNKKDISIEKLNSYDKNDINFLDRWVAGNSSEKANAIGDIPFAISFATPFALLIDGNINDHTGQVMGLYLESLATTATFYTITAGLVNKARPYVYDQDESLDRRTSKNGQRSFYSGHVAATATATFFAAKVFSDFNPDSNAKIYIWAGAATIPAVVGYYRLQAGQHFLTDILLGYGMGAAVGILVPELHKVKVENVKLYPSSGRTFFGDEYSGVTLRYSF
ncbi:phosphatase PAP2 family protein [Aureibaculum sp. 2210JD6-5]|uniref:phosphatase PAP2 family protein n=1 Tax=Aureibaculum sp. 2210JD6-5 TaxID=3103957 RepID=UPI002AAE2970|nr:phosphatase PAP2 family protein [Aureibaculum sp. 2210JD6-5]MDY7394963.1 phosphatase PAP2 family protein [Aureibaculum sp. 2210JD6-5]